MHHPRLFAVVKCQLLLFVAAVFLLVACQTKAVSRNGYYGPLVAATDDTVHNYAVCVAGHHRFYYTITYGNQGPAAKREFYHGDWEYRADTLVLHYHKHRPAGMTDYLLREVTGEWLIQFFTDGRQRVFLRMPRRPFR